MVSSNTVLVRGVCFPRRRFDAALSVVSLWFGPL